MIQAEHILRKFWGFNAFKPAQEKIIASVLNHDDTLALLPTGGGKSICFQVPALVNEGICIVVSPLIALMQDQVNVLKSKGIKALALTSGLSFADIDAALDNCIYGNYKFLYLSPERLQQDLVQERIQSMNVNLIAVDEAHCISEWGHDFRPAYQEISVLRDLHPSVPIIALTATATPKVVVDIQSFLELYQPEIVRQSFQRENIAFKSVKVNDKHRALLNELKDFKNSSAIIYLRNRRGTVDASNFLNSKGFRSTYYHGGISNEEKKERLERWLNNETPIMVATNAFGMGIDKPDVRKVIHFNFADSIESYYQEAGRAGRDDKPSEAVLIFNDSDKALLKDMFLKNLPTPKDVKLVYAKLNSYFSIAYGEGKDETFSFNFYKFCQQYQLNTQLTYQALQTLDRTSVLMLTRQFAKKSSIQFLLSSKHLGRYLEENPKYEALVKAVLRSYGGVFEGSISINIDQVLKKANLSEDLGLIFLKTMHDQEVISFQLARHDASISFLVPREDDHTINPLIPYINQQKQRKEQKVKAFIDYVENTQNCRNKQLMQYFGETVTSSCGICSVCLENASIIKVDTLALKKDLIQYLKSGFKTSEELARHIGQPKSMLLQILSELIVEEVIIKTPENTFKLL